MTLKTSMDEGKTWPVSRVIHEGPASYSDVAVARDKSILVIYESGNSNWHEYIALARVNLSWLMEGNR